MIVLENDHMGAGREAHGLGGGGRTVTDRGRERDLVGVGTDQSGRRLPRRLGLPLLQVRRERPGPRLALHAAPTGLDDGAGKRRVGGGIEVGDVARHVEEMALGRKHRGHQTCAASG